MSIEDICREHCKPYSSDLSILEYEQCLLDCRDLHNLLVQFVELIKKHCKEEVKERPEIIRDRVHRKCVAYYLGMIIYYPELAEKILKLIANNMEIEL